MKPQWQSAADLMKEMAADPVTSRRLRARAERSKTRTERSIAAMEPVLRKVESLGFEGETLEEVVKLNAPLPELLVSALLSSLNGLEPRQQEMIVRALGAASQPFNATVLVDLFAKTTDHALKWCIVSTFALNKSLGIQQWRDSIKGTVWEKTFEELRREHMQ
jgi:hypothetical protein